MATTYGDFYCEFDSDSLEWADSYAWPGAGDPAVAQAEAARAKNESDIARRDLEAQAVSRRQQVTAECAALEAEAETKRRLLGDQAEQMRVSAFCPVHFIAHTYPLLRATPLLRIKIKITVTTLRLPQTIV